ncbi:hypothetical protein T05_14900 [Trichinella murrelli]|uniref:Uncharacterized protein n=1 Tax=Trichinella murrelli TaxID=144512 RepID=A0A0V0TYQ1_9BILA|nr:hypothetical protein T05_14900 [Trichinella murrelli]
MFSMYMWHSVLYNALLFAKVAYQLTAEHIPEFYYEHVAGTILLATHLSDKHYLSEKRLRGALCKLSPNPKIVGRVLAGNHVAGTILLATHLSDKHYLSEKRLRGRISFVNNGWRELKETPSSNWKIPCLAIMFGVSEKRPSSN